MSSVDNRVVNMQFNNAQFEKGVSQSLSSLEKLEKGLNLKSSTQNLKDLEATANKFSFAGMDSAVQSIAHRFSTFGVMGMTAIQNITNTAIRTGKRLTSALTGPIIQGGKQRAQNIEQAKFQIEGLGKKWEDVEEDINYGVQDTAYGLDAAAKAASQLLASDVKLGTEMNTSLRGISGVAAMTSSSYEDISQVFTRVAGNGRLMATELNSLSARGINAAATIGKYLGVSEKEVREMTSKGQIDFQTFAKAMDDAFGTHAKDANKTFSGALSNMKASLSRLGEAVATPTYKDLRDIFNSLTPIFNNLKTALTPFIDALNNRLASATKNIVKILDKFGYVFDENGNKVPKKAAKVLIKTIQNITDSIQNVAKFISAVFEPIKKAFRDIFPKQTINDIKNFTEKIKEFTSKLVVSSSTADKLRRIFRGVFALFDIGKTIITRLIGLFIDIWKSTDKARGGFLEFAAKIGDFIVKVDEAIKENKFLVKSFETIKNVFTAVSNAIHTAGTKIKNVFNSITSGFKGSKNSLNILDRLSNLLNKAATAISNFAKAVADRLLGDDINKSSELFNKIINFGFVAALLKFKKELANGGGFLSKFTKPLTDLSDKLGNIMGSVNKLFDGLSGAVKSFSLKVKSEVLLNVAKGIALLAAALFVLSTIDSDSLYTSISIMSILFTELAAFTKSFSKAFGGSKSALNVPGLLAGAVAIEMIGLSVLTLAGALKMLEGISAKDLTKGVAAIGALLAMLNGTVKLLSSKASKEMSKGITGLVAMALAVRILTKSLIELSALSWEELGKGGAAVGALIGALGGFVVMVSQLGEGKKVFAISTALVILGAALEIFVNVASKFASMSWEDLGKAGASIGTLLGALGGFVTMVSKLGNGKRVFAISTALVILSASLEIIANVASKFASMSWESLGKAGAAIVVLLGALGGFVTMVSKLGKGGRFLVASIGIIILSGALEIMADAVTKFSKLPFDKMFAATAAINSLMTIIIIFNKAVDVGDLLVQAIGLIGFGFAIEKLTKSVAALAAIDIFNLTKAILAMSILLDILVDFSDKMKDAKKIAVAVGSIVALAKAVQVLASIGWLGLIVGVGGLAAVFTVLGVGTKLLAPMIDTMRQLALSMLTISGSMLTMGLAMISVGFGLVMIGSGFTAIATAAGAVGNVIVPFAKSVLEAAPIIAEAIYSILINLLTVIDKFAPKLFDTIFKLAVNALKTLGKLIPELGKFIAKFIKDIAPILTKQLPTLARLLLDFISSVLDVLIEKAPEIVVKVIKLIQVIFKSIFDAIGDIKPESFAGAIAAFGALIGLFVALGAAKKYLKDALATGLGMMVVFGLMTAMFLILNTMETEKILTIALGLSGALAAIATCMAIASYIPAAAAAQGIGSLAIAIGGITAILTALGALKQIPGLKWLIDEGAELLKSIGKAIGGFIGSIVGGFLEGMTDGLIGMADNLSEFMIRLTPFLVGAKMITPESLEGVKALAGVILTLTAAEILDGIASWITGGSSIAKFGTDLALLAPGIVAYSQAVAGNIAVEDVKASAVALLALGEMASKLPKSGGLAGFFGGESMSMKEFGKQIVDFADSAVDYSKAVSGKDFDVKAIKASASAASAMSKVANNLPKHGFAQFFGGENMSMDDFGKQLKSFGDAMVEYSKAVSAEGFSVKAIKASASAAEGLSKLANNLPKHGFAQFFGGENMKMDDFGLNLAWFGVYLAKYSQAVEGIKIEPIKASAEVAQSLANLSNSLSETDGFAQFFSGKKDLKTFGESLEAFGSCFVNYSKTVSGIKTENLDKLPQITDQLKAMISVMDAIGKSGFNPDSGKNFVDGVNTIAEANIEDLIAAFKRFYSDGDNAETLQNVGKNLLLCIANGMLINSEDLSGKVSKIADNMLKGLNVEINDETKHKKFKEALKWYKDELTSFEKKTKDTFKSLGSTIVSNWITGMENKRDKFGDKLYKFGEKISSYDEKYQKKAIAIGKHIIEGLSAGMKSKDIKEKPANVLVDIARDMIKRFRKELEVKSPSRKTFSIGRFTILGFVNAIKQYSGLVYNAMGNVANTVLETLSTPLSNVSDFLTKDLDNMDPTIRPVLDLTDVQNGTREMQNLFDDSTYSLKGMTLNGAAISGNIGLTDETPVYNDANVISEIAQLREDVSTLSEAIQSLDIVLDTGATVGALSPGIDKELGRTASLKERGI